MRVAKKLRKRRKRMYRDRDFGGPAMGRARTLKDLSQGRATTRTDLSANNTLTQIEAAKHRVLPSALLPETVKTQLQLEREREEAAQAMLELQGAEAAAAAAALAGELKEGDIDPETGKVLDINDIELRKIRAEQARLAPLQKKEERHQRTGGKNYVRMADKVNDPDRLTWDEFRKLHAKDMGFGQDKEMGEYRKRLDEEREHKLHASQARRQQSAKELKAKRKAKRKRKADAMKSGEGGGSGSDDSDSDGAADVGAGALSAFLQGGSDDDDDADDGKGSD
jgi:hypothetical protein